MINNDCIFCQIVAKKAQATVVVSGDHSLGIVPLNPVTEGHVIFLAREHVTDAAEGPFATGRVTQDAAAYARGLGAVNIITSVGAAATQSVWHLHVHVVPRRRDDALMLPWGSNEAHMRENDRMAYEFYNGSGIGADSSGVHIVSSEGAD